MRSGKTIMTIITAMMLTACQNSPTSVFKSAVKPELRGASSGYVARTWKTPVFIDHSDLDANYQNENYVSAPDPVEASPVAVYNLGILDFGALYTRDVATYVSGSWSSAGYRSIFAIESNDSEIEDFTQLYDKSFTSGSFEARAPKSEVDAYGNVLALYGGKATAGGVSKFYPLLNIRYASTGSWSSPQFVGSDSITGDLHFTSSKVKALSNGGSLIGFCQTDAGGERLLYNYLSSSGSLRYSRSIAAATAVIDSSYTCDTTYYGMDIAEDANLNSSAILAAPTSGSSISFKRWNGYTYGWDNAISDDVITGTGVIGFPKIFVDSTGTYHLFYYNNISVAGGTAANLYYRTGSYNTLFQSGAASTFDSGVGVGSIFVRYFSLNSALPNNYIPPLFAEKNGRAVVGFIKSDGTNQRLYASIFSKTTRTFSTPTQIDAGSADVNHSTAAMNAKGDIVVGYVKTIGTDERVFANYYSADKGAWIGESQVDSIGGALNQAFDPFTYGQLSRPVVSIDSDGNAIIVFNVWDANNGNVMRTVASSYTK